MSCTIPGSDKVEQKFIGHFLLKMQEQNKLMRSSSVLAKKQHNITRNNTTTYSQISQCIPSSGAEIDGDRLLSEAQIAQLAS